MDTDIYYLSDYNWCKGSLVSVGRKNYKISSCGLGLSPALIRVPKEKCAFPDENVCVVWETWKGKNGRGGYRVERELYPELRVPAKNVNYQHIGLGRVKEKAYGVT